LRFGMRAIKPLTEDTFYHYESRANWTLNTEKVSVRPYNQITIFLVQTAVI
jgi:hypothetical protein